MDETHQSRTSDAAAAATRKRRSSILKSQRPPRTPFSELEFHVTTPPDTAKSRRVSFSRRTGVAEFVTNEATTTWKNFYEEHNKSMESSGNESGMNAPRQTIGHLGKRIFDQQFQEVMAVDLITTNDNLSIRNVNSSYNNANLTQQLASLECTSGTNLSLPQQKFEMSAVTDHQSKFFDDLAAPTIGEMSGKIDINFSAVQTIGSGELKDDLDEIQQDLQRARSNIVCGGPFTGGRDMSEYIEVDLNATHVTIPNDVSDMSITDTIRSPKVQDVSKSNSINKPSSKKDWIEDKENIGAYGTCSMPVVSSNERRRTVVYENDTGNISITQAVPTILISSEEPKSDKRKTIVYESDSADISVTQALPVDILIVNKGSEKRKTIIFENDTGNVSVTQAIPTNIMLPEKTKTIISEDDFGNISITQAVPSAKIISESAFTVENCTEEQMDRHLFVQSNDSEKRKTIVYENEAANISETQGIPPNIISTIEIKSKNQNSPDKPEHGISFSNIEVSNKRKTIVFDDDINNISITQAIPANIIESKAFEQLHKNNSSIHNRSKIHAGLEFENKINFLTNKRKTIVFDDDINNISITQAIPANIIESKAFEQLHRNNSSIHNQSNIENIQTGLQIKSKDNILTNKRKTIVFDDDMSNISMTQAVPANIIESTAFEQLHKNNSTIHSRSNIEYRHPGLEFENDDNIITNNKRKTIVFDDDMNNISITQAMPANIIISRTPEKDDQAHSSNYTAESKLTKSFNKEVSLLDDKKCIVENRRRTVLFEKDNENANMSITEAIPHEKLIREVSKTGIQENNDLSLLDLGNKVTDTRRRTVVFDKDEEDANMSITQALPRENLLEELNKISLRYNKDFTLLDDENITTDTRRRTVVFENDNENADMSITEAIPRENLNKLSSLNETKHKDISLLHLNMTSEAQMKSKIFENDNQDANMSIDSIPLEHLTNVANKTDDHELTISNKDTLLDNSYKEKVLESHSADVSMSIKITAPEEYVMEDIKHEKSQNNDFADLDSNRSITSKQNTQESVKVNESMFKSTIENLPKNDSIEGVKLEDIYDMSMTKPADAKSMLMELEKSIVSKHLNKSDAKYQISNITNKSITQDIFVYQAVTQNDLIVKDSSSSDPPTGIAADEFEQKSFTKSISKESNLETDTSIQMSQAHLLQQETNEEANSSSALKESKLTSLTSFKISENSKNAILDDLLDMSSTSLDTSTDKNIETSEDVNKSRTDNISSHSLIHVRDSDEETQTEQNEEKKNRTLKYETPLPLEYEEEVNSEADNVTEKLSEIEKLSEDKKESPTNRIYEKIRSSDLGANKSMNKSESINKRESINKTESMNNTDVKEKLNVSKAGKSFRDANDTNELLEMLSDLTDKSRVLKDEEKPRESIKNLSQYPEANEPRRWSVAPNRLSIVISREDLLNNISMAHAALQRSIEIDESLADTTITPEENSPPQKSNRASNEVAKKLHFEDESDSEISIRSDMKTSPLKKTAFGESEHMKDTKAKVIPSYLKDVSDELKSLMDDLVKPNADSVPYQTLDKSLMRDPSTCSTQIQANLITSSQIDIDTEVNSVVESTIDVDKESLPSSSIGSKSFSSSAKTSVTEKRVPRDISFRPQHVTSPEHSSSERVIVFDHLNPLNNILLAPSDYSNVHKYNPPSNETLREEQANKNEADSPKEKEPHNVTAQYNIESVLISQSLKQCGDSEMITDTQSAISNNSKIGSTRVCELKDTEINTMIAMKGNKELLETSSSLTLVDDALAPNTFDVDLDSVVGKSTSSNTKKSPVKVIYKIEDLDLEASVNKDSDLTSNDETEPVKIDMKPKKRIYSPSKPDKHRRSGVSSLDVTPKPISKMSRMSNSPKSCAELSPQKLKAEKDEPDQKMDVDAMESKNSVRAKKKSKSPQKPGTNVTVQQLITEYNIKGDINQDVLSKQILDTLSRSDSSTAPNTVSVTDFEVKSPDIVSSFTSSKNQDEMHNVRSVTTTDTVSNVRSRLEWQPVTESSKNLVSECESSVNVVANIDMLPFMGSHECEWEPSGIDAWSFRMLHARLRLSVRLAHRHNNATRTRVRADTPVVAVALEAAHADKKNSVATLCVGFAAEAMRYFVGRGCARAGDVPSLLRRCAGVARVALRWGRAMHDARLHLAYSLAGDGRLALKVANIPLRSVWEVTMRIELVVEDAREVPWPRACDVRVTRVVSDVRVTDEETRRVLAHLPRDWGHAPRALWKIFRYLKNKTRDDEMLGLT